MTMDPTQPWLFCSNALLHLCGLYSHSLTWKGFTFSGSRTCFVCNSQIVSGGHLSRHSVTSEKYQRGLSPRCAWKRTCSRILSLKINVWFYLTLQNNQLSVISLSTACAHSRFTMAVTSFYFSLFFSKNTFLSDLFMETFHTRAS